MDKEDAAPARSDPLLGPLALKKLRLRNRIISTSHACGLEVGGMPKEAYQRYHEEKARGGIALSMFGGSSNVDRDSPNIFHQLNVGDDAIIPHLQEFSARMHAQGAALMCQITHLGRRGEPYASNWLPTIAPSPVRDAQALGGRAGFVGRVKADTLGTVFGHDIRAGHRVKLTGPFGRAFFRPSHPGRVVLVASGTGFAPMWSVAVAAIMEQPERELVFVVAARSVRSLYMHAALCRLALFPNVTLIPMVSEPQQISHAIRTGRPTDHLPKLNPDDVVYTAGAPAMTDAVALKNVAVSDTLGGMLLTWDKLPEKKWCAGIRISKSRSAMENYVVADTLPPDAVSWIDRKVIGGTVYYYRVEPVLYDLPNKPNATPGLVNGEKKFVSGKMIAPQGLRASLTSGKDVRLSWKPDAALNLFGYYVLRGASLQNMEVISPVVRDTIYVDSLKNLNPGDTYLYALAARNMNMEWSDTSETVTVVCPVNEAVTAPAGLSARYTEHGVRLIWNDVSLADEKIIGYIIYKRKKGDEYFRPLMQHPWQDHIYTDTLMDDAGTYEYGCASMDARGNQSILSSLATVNISGSAYLYPPAGFDLKNSPAGVIVTIPPSVDAAEESSYVVYKRAAAEKQFRKAGSVPAGRPEFVDKQVKKGTLYVYAVSLVRSGSESAMSAEKTIRCR